MDRQIFVDCAATLTTLAESNEPVPASAIYEAMKCDYERYESTISALAGAGAIVKTGDTLELTELGRGFARQIEEAVQGENEEG